MSKVKTGIVMMNLGGPATLDQVEPFLLELFADREIIRLREIESLSYEEIATQMKLPIGTIRSRINRARGQLQSKLKFLIEK